MEQHYWSFKPLNLVNPISKVISDFFSSPAACEINVCLLYSLLCSLLATNLICLLLLGRSLAVRLFDFYFFWTAASEHTWGRREKREDREVAAWKAPQKELKDVNKGPEGDCAVRRILALLLHLFPNCIFLLSVDSVCQSLNEGTKTSFRRVLPMFTNYREKSVAEPADFALPTQDILPK